MTRPLRLAFEDAVYHITVRGNRREDIFYTDKDRSVFLEKLNETFNKYSFICYAYSLMDNHFDGPHLDGFSKLKLGWVRPRILWRSGRYTLPDVETRHVVWILVNPQRSTQEYFLIENRWGGTTYDRILPDAGLAVWHVMDESCLSGQGWMEPPPNIPPDDWGRQGLGGIRRAVRLIRPDPTYDEDTRALWDDGWYDLLSEDDDPKHAELRWADGTPSGFALRRISAAGPDMQVSVEVPFIQGW